MASIGTAINGCLSLLLIGSPLWFFHIPMTSYTCHPHDILHLPSHVVGPVSLAFDKAGGGPFVGTSDGRILTYEELN